MADKVEFLLRARGGSAVAREVGKAAGGIKRVERAADRAHKSVGRFGKGLLGFRASSLLTGASVYGLYREVKRSTGAWEVHRKIAADTARAIKTTGGAANVSAKHVDRLANSIQAKTAVDDDAVAAGQNMLLTFLRVRNEAGKGNKVFDRATKLAVDMSARFGGDTKRSFIQLGKALDDPIKGITALRRTGVSFTAEEQKKIKTLEDTGHHLEAQKYILAALDKQVGGSARAQATPIAKLKQSWGDLEKELGHQLAPTVDMVTRRLGHLTDDATRIMGRKDLSLFGKVRLFARKDIKPQVDQLVAGLKGAHLDDKLQGAVEWAIPKIADGFATAAPRAARAFVHGFQNAGTWGQLLTAAFLAKKLGAFGGLGRLIAGRLGRGGLAGMAIGSAKPVPVYVVNKGGIPGAGGGGGVWSKAKGWIAGGGAAGVAAKGLKAGKFLGPAGVVADALVNADAAGLPAARERKMFAAAQSNVFGYRQGTGRLAGYPDSHTVSNAVRSGIHPLDRLPERVAGAVARRPLALTVHAQPVNVFLDGVKVAESTASVELKYKDRG